jgi:electron transfer flavoprotein alpha subunit
MWVFAEREGDGIRSVSLELLGKIRQLANSLGERVGAVLPCAAAGDLPARLIDAGADVVYVIEHPLLGSFDPIVHKKAIAELVRERRPQVMLFGASPLGRELAPRIAYACRSGLTADCTRLEIGDFSKGAVNLVGILKQTRPALGGNVMATIMTKDSPTQMATVRPGVFKVPPTDPAHTGEIVPVTAVLDADDVGLEATAVESFASKVSIRDAEIIVAGGHGFRSRADFETYLQPLAVGLGRLLGADPKVAASRMAVEDGFTTHDYQVGQTGQTVQPRLYVAIGISGAVQHITGMQGSEIVVAINKDPKARIFTRTSASYTTVVRAGPGDGGAHDRTDRRPGGRRRPGGARHRIGKQQLAEPRRASVAMTRRRGGYTASRARSSRPASTADRAGGTTGASWSTSSPSSRTSSTSWSGSTPSRSPPSWCRAACITRATSPSPCPASWASSPPGRSASAWSCPTATRPGRCWSRAIASPASASRTWAATATAARSRTSGPPRRSGPA